MTRIKIGVAQIDSEQGNVKDNVSRALELIDRLASAGSNFICLPELWNTGYCMRERFSDLAEHVPGPTTNMLGEKALQHDIYIVAGIARRTTIGDIYNAAVLIGPDGRVHGVYDKVHLYSERETGYFKAGSKYPVFDTRYGSIGVMICYDVGYFPEVARTYALAGAELIFCPMAWGPSYRINCGRQIRKRMFEENIWRLRCSSCTRAMENTVFLVVANRVGREHDQHTMEHIEFVGHSMVVAPNGMILSELDENKGSSMMDIELEQVRNRRIEAHNPLKDRRPKSYKWRGQN